MVISAIVFQALLIIVVWQSSSALPLLEQDESLPVSIRGFNSLESTICSSGLEFVSALANSSVRRLVVSTEMHITESDFSAFKIYVERNISVRGMYPEREAWPLLDLGFVRAVVTLAPGVVVTFTHLVLSGLRRGPYFQTPGFDFVAFKPRFYDVLPAYVIVFQAAWIQRTCLPNSVYKYSAPNITRPFELPGSQQTGRQPQWQPCSNDTQVPPMQRCWPAVGHYVDLALYGSELIGVSDTPTFANYILWAVNTTYMCDTLMASDGKCSENLLLCYYSMFPRDEETLTATVDNTTGGTANLTSSSPPPLSLASKATSSEEQSHNISAPMLGGLLGGTIVAVALVFAVITRRWRQHRGVEEAKLQLAADRDTGDDKVSGNDISKGDVVGDDSPPDGLLGQPGSIKVMRMEALHLSASTQLTGCPTTSISEPAYVSIVTSACTMSNVSGGSGQLTRTDIPSGIKVLAACHDQAVPVDKVIHEPITQKSPIQKGVQLRVELDVDGGSDVHLTSEVLGKGSFGRVLVGIYGNVRVAVKLLKLGLMDQASTPAGIAAMSDKQVANAVGGTLQPAVEQPHHLQLKSRQDGQQEQAMNLAESASGSTLLNDEELQPVEEEQDGARPKETGGQEPLIPRHTSDDRHRQVVAACGQAGGIVKQGYYALLQEVEVLARCQHPNIVRLLAASLEPPRECLVMELMDISLDGLLYSSGIKLQPLDKVLHIVLQIARALSYLHPTVLHRDIKPANVLISQPDSPRPIVKLADFGLSRLRETVMMTRNPEVGTAPYMAPETFDLCNNVITDRVDIYALGVIFWEMLAGVRPWEGLNVVQIAYGISLQGIRLPLGRVAPERCPRRVKHLICRCWDRDPARRPAAPEVVKELALIFQQITLKETPQRR